MDLPRTSGRAEKVMVHVQQRQHLVWRHWLQNMEYFLFLKYFVHYLPVSAYSILQSKINWPIRLLSELVYVVWAGYSHIDLLVEVIWPIYGMGHWMGQLCSWLPKWSWGVKWITRAPWIEFYYKIISYQEDIPFLVMYLSTCTRDTPFWKIINYGLWQKWRKFFS